MNKIKITYIILLLFSFGNLYSQEIQESNVENLFKAVVLVRNEGFISENKIQPWMKKNLSTGLGTGMVIGPNLILTNAHVVTDSSRINIRLGGSKKNYPAEVKFIGNDCDLALLQVTDPDFSKETSVLTFSDTYPILGSDLLLLGFPNGQENLTVEKGSVIRVEKNRYSYSGLDFRNVIKISANIQPGNSGGPAIQNGKVVGLTFQISKTGKDIAYLIPIDIIKHFLKDVITGSYAGFPNLGFTFQSGAPTSLKEGMKIPVQEKGIFVNRIYPNSTFSKILKEKDFIFALDGRAISNEGEVASQSQKESIIDYVENKQLGEKVVIEVYRAGKKYRAEATLQKNFALDLYRETPDIHLLSAGFVFQPISRSFFNSEDGDLDSSMKYHYSYFIQDLLYRYTTRDIVLSYIFDDPETIKYKKFKFKVLESINEKIPRDLDDLKRIWKENAKDFIVLRFRGMELPIVLRSQSVGEINIRVKKRFGTDYEN